MGTEFALKAEYQFFSNVIDYTTGFRRNRDAREIVQVNNTSPGRYHLHPNRTRKILADYYRQLIENISCPCADLKLPGKMETIEPHSNSLFQLIRPNINGKLILTLVPEPENFSGLFEIKRRIQTNLSALRIIIACRLYEMKYGDLPQTLASLTPEFLDDIPIDPYDGRPLRYLPDKQIVYSVGQDSIDSTDQTEPPQPDKSDDLIYQTHPEFE